MIIGVSGKKGSGKDTVGKIIQYFTSGLDKVNVAYDTWDGNTLWNTKPHDWQIRKFADALKNIVCILIGCTREQLEDIDFKNSKLGDEWIRYGYADGFSHVYRNGNKETIMNNKQCSKERYEEELKVNWQTAYKHEYTVRELLQRVGTDAIRNVIHEDAWINALMSQYKPFINPSEQCDKQFNPNWIITDVRFPNEAKVIKDRNGIVIRVNRFIGKRVYVISNEQPFENWYGIVESYNHNGFYNVINSVDDVILVHKNQIILQDEHSSETALDDYEFDYTIDNNGTIEELVEKVREILIKKEIL